MAHYRVESWVPGSPLIMPRRVVMDSGEAVAVAEHLKEAEGVGASVTEISGGEALNLLNDLLAASYRRALSEGHVD